jgi:hypothetical protein
VDVERHVDDAARKRPLAHDKGGDKHYDFISAWIKATRAGDAGVGLLPAAMLEGGEDARFIVRRMIVLASEDIGNADRRLLVMIAAAHAVEHVGLPEARLGLAGRGLPRARTEVERLVRGTEARNRTCRRGHLLRPQRFAQPPTRREEARPGRAILSATARRASTSLPPEELQGHLFRAVRQRHEQPIERRATGRPPQ